MHAKRMRGEASRRKRRRERAVRRSKRESLQRCVPEMSTTFSALLAPLAGFPTFKGRVAAEAFTGLLNPSRKVRSTAPSHPDARHFISVHPLLRHPMVPAGGRGMVQTALESRKIWALQVVRSAAAGRRMAPPKGAEWRTGWTGAACWRRTHRCKLFCCSTRLLPHPLRPPAPRDRRAWVRSFNQSRRGAALSRRR